jgi:hypothetical protein
LDFKKEKCKAIFSVKDEAKSATNPPTTKPDPICDNFLFSGFLIPISLLIILGVLGLGLKKVFFDRL